MVLSQNNSQISVWLDGCANKRRRSVYLKRGRDSSSRRPFSPSEPTGGIVHFLINSRWIIIIFAQFYLEKLAERRFKKNVWDQETNGTKPTAITHNSSDYFNISITTNTCSWKSKFYFHKPKYLFLSTLSLSPSLLFPIKLFVIMDLWSLTPPGTADHSLDFPIPFTVLLNPTTIHPINWKSHYRTPNR